MIAKLVGDYLRERCPSTVEIEVMFDNGGAPFYVDPGSADSLAAQRALEPGYGRAPALIKGGA